MSSLTSGPSLCRCCEKRICTVPCYDACNIVLMNAVKEISGLKKPLTSFGFDGCTGYIIIYPDGRVLFAHYCAIMCKKNKKLMRITIDTALRVGGAVFVYTPGTYTKIDGKWVIKSSDEYPDGVTVVGYNQSIESDDACNLTISNQDSKLVISLPSHQKFYVRNVDGRMMISPARKTTIDAHRMISPTREPSIYDQIMARIAVLEKQIDV